MNPWKKAFLILAAVVVGVILALPLIFFTSIKKTEEPAKIPPVKADGVEIEMIFTNQELENLLNLQLEKESAPLRIQIEDVVSLKGSIPIFSFELPLEIKAEASPAEEGRIALEILEISGESIQFPRGIVLSALAQVLDQTFFVIEPDQNRLVIDPNQLAEGFFLSAKEINLKENKISFTTIIDEKYLVPVK